MSDEAVQPESGIPNGATLSSAVSPDGVLRLTLGGRLDSGTTATVWRDSLAALDEASPPKLVLDAHDVHYCDGVGLGLLLELRMKQIQAGREVEIEGLADEFQRLLEQFDVAKYLGDKPPRRTTSHLPVQIGKAAVGVSRDLYALVTFVGALAWTLVLAVVHPRRVRWRDAVLAAEKAGVDALPIIALITFLVGLIMAYQSAIPLGRFGAQIYIAELVALSIVRELGALMTAIILAGRTGSAFAAEIGTMKVNEEVDALKTMGLEPIRFLVAPRVIAVVVMTPLLAVLANLCGLLGGAVVFVSETDYALRTYYDRVTWILTVTDLLSGLFKSLVFGLIVAGIGCLRGLQTTTGASAVGNSTTRAVVAGILLIIVADGIFAVVFNSLGI